MAKGRPGFPQISVHGPILTYMRQGSLQAHTGKCGFSNDKRNTFLGSPYPQLLFDIYIAFVERRYHGERQTRPFSYLYCLTWYGVVCRPAQVSAAFAPTRGIHFWALYTRSFLLIETLPWCKHGTMVNGRPAFPQISVLGHILTYMRRGTLQARTGKYGFWTDQKITFLGSPYQQLPFNINIVVVQTLYHGEWQTGISSNFSSPICTYLPYMRQFAGSHRKVQFLHRREKCVFGLSIPLAFF